MANKKKPTDFQPEETKVRYPKGNEFIGKVERRHGGSRMTVRSSSGETYLARVPGRVKKFLWIREGNIVLLQPWEYDTSKADLVYKYKDVEIKKLEEEGYLDSFETTEEF